MNATFTKIESDIFDCDFFKEKYRAEYEANIEEPEVIKRILIILKKEGCPDDDEFLMELDSNWKKYATEKNAEIRLLAQENQFLKREVFRGMTQTLFFPN